MARDVGRCIYCGAHGPGVKLQREHIIPYSLGSDTYLKNASCPCCAKITRDIETHVARNIYGHLRIHIGVQTRHPEQRPQKLPIRIVHRGLESRVELPINQHPFFLVLPAWRIPTILDRHAALSSQFEEFHSKIFSYVPDTIRQSLKIDNVDDLAIGPDGFVDVVQFSRVLMKIAYCQCVALFGLDGFEHPVAPSLVLGKFKSIPYLVGVEPGDPKPPAPAHQQHHIEVVDATVPPARRVLLVKIRLFADSGTSGGNDSPSYGMPTYLVVVGEPNALTHAVSH